MNVGFLLSHLGSSPLTDAFVDSANQLIATDRSSDIIAFVNNQAKSKSFPTFASMSINEAFNYDGAMVATNLDLAAKLIRLPGPRLKYYYLWELDWTKQAGWSFEQLLEVFQNPKLSLIARTDEDKKVIEQCWNVRIDSVIPDCNVTAFVEKIRKDEK